MMTRQAEAHLAALNLAVLAADGADTTDAATELLTLCRTPTVALTILARLVRVDLPATRWSRSQYGYPLRPCGTHAAYHRHRQLGPVDCPPCLSAERIYQRDRHRARAAKRRSEQAA